MVGKKLFERLPIFGDVEINLKNDSKTVFAHYSEELERLRDINQLGILHEFLNIPAYRKYDYVMTMLFLIERASNYNSDFSKSVKLRNDIIFSSSDELLKSWCLLYSIGHLKMTFAAEHALMRVISNNKESFLNKTKEFLALDDGDEVNEILLKKIKKIIEKEDFMEIYKIFTLLKIKSKTGHGSENYNKKIIELSKIMILKEDYLSILSENIEQKIKMEKLINYFEIIRKLCYTILDGSISQKHLNLNHFLIIEDLDSYLSNENYQNLIDNLNKFYTSDIFNSPESSYYHHRAVILIEDIFKKYEFKDFLENIFEFNFYEDDISKSINEFKKEIEKKNMPVNEDTGLNFIKSELKDHIRIIYNKNFEKIISLEKECFKKRTIFGGLLPNLAEKNVQVDIYPNSEECDKKTKLIYPILNIVSKLYGNENFNLARLIKDLHNIFIKAKDHPDFSHEIKNIDDTPIKGTLDLLVESQNYGEFYDLIQQFKNLANYLFQDSIKFDANFSSIDLGPEKFKRQLKYPLFFRKTELNTFISYLENLNSSTEHKKILEQLKSELSIEEEEKSIFYVFSPNTKFILNKNVVTEIDFLLIKYCLDRKKRIVKIGEIKPGNQFREEQCINQLEIIFNISRSDAKSIFHSSLTNKEPILDIKISGTKSDSILKFEKHEKLVNDE